MIINPYSIVEIEENTSNAIQKDDLVEKSIEYLITDYKELIENKKTDDIRKVLEKYYISKKLKLSSLNIDNIVKKVTNKLFG